MQYFEDFMLTPARRSQSVANAIDSMKLHDNDGETWGREEKLPTSCEIRSVDGAKMGQILWARTIL